MKPTLLFAMLSMVFAMPQASALTELETLRARCTEQERQIRRLEEQVQNLKTADSASAPSSATSKAAASTEPTYTVRGGDSIERIARKAGCSPAKLAKTNGLKPSSVIRPGQKLKLPGAAAAPAISTTPTAVVSAPADKTHAVQAGETYASIARKHQVSIESLVAANPEVKPTGLRPGQVIRLATSEQVSTASSPAPETSRAATTSKPAPMSTTISTTRSATPTAQVSKTSPASAPATAQAAPAKPAETPAQKQTSSPNPEKKIRSVTIDGEMTYGEFASSHGTDTSRLNDLNGLDLTNATVLAKGSELYVPAQP